MERREKKRGNGKGGKRKKWTGKRKERRRNKIPYRYFFFPLPALETSELIDHWGRTIHDKNDACEKVTTQYGRQ